MRNAVLTLCVLVGCGGEVAASDAAPAIVAAPPPAPIAFTRVRLEPIVHDDVLVVPRATVCIPEVDAPLPVLYALDGDYFVDELALCDEVERAVNDGSIPPWVVVSVGSTEDRTEMLAGHPERLARTVIEELEPSVRAHVLLRDERESRAVIGFSYGGLAAVRFALGRPNDFGRVIAMSPSLWVANRSTLRLARTARLPMRLYVDAGAREGDEGEVVPYMIDDARSLVDLARERGMVFGRDVALREVPGQSHDMALASTRLPGALRFVLGTPALDSARPESVIVHPFDAPRPQSPRTFSVDAAYASGIVLSWPLDLAHARLGESALTEARLPALSPTLHVEVGGVMAEWAR